MNTYGNIFKIHIFGNPTTIMASVETNQFFFQNEGRLFKSVYLYLHILHGFTCIFMGGSFCPLD